MKRNGYEREKKAKTWGIDHKLRLLLVSFFFVLILSVLLWRLYSLIIVDRQFLLEQGQARSLRIVDIPAYRGMIVDRQGSPLAVSTPVKSIWVNPKTFAPDEHQLKDLSKILDMPQGTLSKRLKQSRGREFIYLKRQLTPYVAKKIDKLNIPGVNFQEEFKRYYPESESTAQLIGFTNIDDTGIEGLELAFDQWLDGVVGKKRVVKDRLGRITDELNFIREPRPGNLLQISIDKRIQYAAYHELQKTVEEFGAKSGTAIVLEAKTGEVLAVANAPSFNPNARERYGVERYRNKAFTDTFEPGSVVKPLSVASALESGLYKPGTEIDTRPSWMMIGGHAIRDVHNYGVLDVTGVLQHSSNIGVTKMVLSSPAEQLIQMYIKSGYSFRTASGYPGESTGEITSASQATPFVLATMAFGYGLSVTPIQLAQSYMPFANNGKLLSLSLLHRAEKPEESAVMSAKTAQQVLTMMETVVKPNGTGKLARIPGYRVAGKTGTARIAGNNGYESSRHIASFVGIAPASDPRLIVAVVINEPKRVSYYGGAAAAPLFAKIMGAALRILDISPDDIEKV